MSERAITTYKAPLPARIPVIDGGMDIQTLGKVFAASGFFADAKQESQAIVKILAGAELGFPPIASMTGIFVVQGRITLSANLMAAKVKSSGRYNYRVLQLTPEICEIEFYENGQPIGRSPFTIAEARTAGTQNLQKFPRNMLFARAMSNGCKWYCPDIFGGSPPYTPEELGAEEVHDAGGEVVGIVSPMMPRQYPDADPLTGEIPQPNTPRQVAEVAPKTMEEGLQRARSTPNPVRETAKRGPETVDEWNRYIHKDAAGRGWTAQQIDAALEEYVDYGVTERAVEELRALALAIRNGTLKASTFDTFAEVPLDAEVVDVAPEAVA